VLWYCWLGHVTRKTVSKITYNVSSGTLNSTIPRLGDTKHCAVSLRQLNYLFSIPQLLLVTRSKFHRNNYLLRENVKTRSFEMFDNVYSFRHTARTWHIQTDIQTHRRTNRHRTIAVSRGSKISETTCQSSRTKSVVLTEPEFSIQSSKSFLVVLPLAVKSHTAVFPSHKHLEVRGYCKT